MASKTAHWSELPTLSTLGGWDLGMSLRGVAAFQWLRVRTNVEYMNTVTRAAKRAGKDMESVFVGAAELAWRREENAA